MKLILPRLLSIKTQLLSIFLASICIIVTLFVMNFDFEEIKANLREITEEQARRTHVAIVNEFLKERQNWTTSAMGSWLFKFEEHIVPQNRTFSVYFGGYSSSGNTSLEDCSVRNCVFTADNKKLETVDAILIHLQRDVIPKLKHRNSQQRWIFMNDESPYSVFSLQPKAPRIEDLAEIFNWSMTYRIEADIPRLYGRTVPLDEPLFKNFDTSALTEVIPKWNKKRRDVLVSILISNCYKKYRMIFVKKLQSYISVDVYGGCSQNASTRYKCPGHFRRDCDLLSEYLFYLALENADCRDYLTEKIWHNAYSKGAVPIIMGPSLSDCKRFLPPNSYLYISMDYKDSKIKELAKHITELSENEDQMLDLHQWRNHFAIINEHSYFGRKSLLLCRLCEGLNYNDVGIKIYTEKDIRWFIDPRLTCGKNNTLQNNPPSVYARSMHVN